MPDDFVKLPDDLCLTYVEVLCAPLNEPHRSGFERRINDIFNAHRLSFRLVEGRVVPFASDELHVATVEPALRLLVGQTRFEKAQQAYMNALKEVSRNEAADAITDAGTALQEALVALGCEGSSLGPLITSAKKKGLFAGHDQTLINGIEKFLSWVSADRSENGDAHKAASEASLDDAWLMVHVVGPLIVRLAAADTPRRGQTPAL